MSFVRLPFGILNACSDCTLLMRIVLSGLENVTFYFDNIYVYGETFESHLAALEQVLVRLEQHVLTVKPSKCHFVFPTINYLGFVVGNNEVRPQLDKVSAILNTLCLETKKSLRSFLRLASFYRKFMSIAATITASLTDKLKEGLPEQLVWSAQSRRDIFRQLFGRSPLVRCLNYLTSLKSLYYVQTPLVLVLERYYCNTTITLHTL